MGLAASQARLLSITSRKTDAQFESMRLSHQKLALSRSMTDVSNQYQCALNKTKLYYDFYGNGSTDNILSYNLLMTPSYINECTPMLITNQQNRIVLSSNFAAAARAAGIPKEGLDGYIDTTTRNKFIAILNGLGEIDLETANIIQQTEYNPYVGMGSATGIYATTEAESYSNFDRTLVRTRLSNFTGLRAVDLRTPTYDDCSGIMASILTTEGSTAAQYIADSQVKRLSDTESFNFCAGNQTSFSTSTTKWNDLSLYDILYGDDIILTQNVQRGVNVTDALNPNQYDDMINIVKSVIDLLADELEDAYALDDTVEIAIKQAYTNMDAACWTGYNMPKLAVTTVGNADYRTDVDGEQGWSGAHNEGTGYSTLINFNREGFPPYFLNHRLYSQTVIGAESRSNTSASYLNLNYLDDELLVHLPCYSEWDSNFWHYTFHEGMAGFEFFRTAEDNAFGEGGSGTHGFEPAAYWVSLPSTIAAGNNMQYTNVYREDGTIDPSYNDNDNTIDTSGSNSVPEGVYHNSIVADQEAHGYEEENNIEGNGVNKARRNAMVNTINGAANNLALFNLYDYTGDYANCDEVALDNKNYGGNYGSINLSAFVRAWYTYFIESIANSKLDDPTSTSEEIALANSLVNGDDALNVRFHSYNGNSRFVDESYDLSAFEFDKKHVIVDDGIANIACFYDTIINQICEYGWTENNNVKDDTSYLQEMLQSGKMFLFKLAGDNYYYQKGYSSDTYVKEVADEVAIAEAEARYQAQKARITAKEEEIDVKMKNLDTEISALETEYEAVKKMISTNVQKSFTRYQS